MSGLDRTLIVGAGVAGLALAAALRRAGLWADVVERRAEGARDGAGIHLAGNAVRVLDALGVAEALAARAQRATHLHYSDARGETLFRIDLTRLSPRWPFLGAHRADLQDVLEAAAGPGVLRFGIQVRSLEERGDRVEVGFDDGSAGAYSLVVGADGVRSALRERLFPGARAVPFGDYWSFRFVTQSPAGLREPSFMLGVERTLLLFPIGGGRVYCGAGPIRIAGEPPAGAALVPWLREAYRDFGGCAGEVLAAIASPAEVSASRIWSVHQRPWHRGRVLLVGDAAHACPPTLAQGAAQALEDAFVLAKLLSEGGSISDTLAAFEARRRPRVEAVQTASERRMTVTEVREPAQLAVRDALLRRIGEERLAAGWRPLIDTEP